MVSLVTVIPIIAGSLVQGWLTGERFVEFVAPMSGQ